MRACCTLLLIASLLISFPAAPVAAADDKELEIYYKREVFLNSAIGRLQGQVSPYLVDRVKSKAAHWEKFPTERNWVEATDAVTFTATKYRVVSDVTIVTLPNDGATIKYQPVGQRERREPPITAKKLTTCVETMPIGRYHIWAERKGKTTSNTVHMYEIVKPEEKVQIDEDIVSGKGK